MRATEQRAEQRIAAHRRRLGGGEAGHLVRAGGEAKEGVATGNGGGLVSAGRWAAHGAVSEALGGHAEEQLEAGVTVDEHCEGGGSKGKGRGSKG